MPAAKHWQTAGLESEEGSQRMMILVIFTGLSAAIMKMMRMKK
jgi:hypothetical protein